MNNKYGIGAVPSNTDGIPEFKTLSDEESKLKEYVIDYGGILNQGNSNICSSLSLVDSLNYFRKIKGLPKISLPLDYFFNKRQDKSIDGMSIRESLDIAVKEGMIKKYAKVQRDSYLKSAINFNGPCIIGLPVYNFDSEFWKKTDSLKGYHAVLAVGYNEYGFIIKNSWGTKYADFGTCILPYSDFKYIKEIFTILY